MDSLNPKTSWRSLGFWLSEACGRDVTVRGVVLRAFLCPKVLRTHILRQIWAQRPYYIRLLGYFAP